MPFSRFRPRWGWVPLVLLSVFVGLGATFRPPDDVTTHLRTRIEAARQGADAALAVTDDAVQARRLVVQHYQQTEFAPGWVESGGPTPLVDSLLGVLRNAPSDGLRTADYHTDAIEALTRRLRSSADARALADLDLLCTDAFLLYGTHLLGGRADRDVRPADRSEHQPLEVLPHLRRALDAQALGPALAALRPPHAEYHQLRRALARYRLLAARDGWPSVPTGPALKEGMRDDRVPRLRQRLQATGELSLAASPDARHVDATLRRAVGRFQERHGLTADGVVGPATRAALNVPVNRRIRQIEVNLERWRWLPRTLGNPHVRVNVADFWLHVMENAKPVLQMRVVVGKDGRKTPVFSDNISYLVINPYWYVPHRIAVEDKLPLFQRNPALFDRLGYDLFRGWGDNAVRVDPSTIDWKALSAEAFPYRLRQQPGPTNALGQFKFMFPNPHDIYLHDTPTRGDFRYTRRMFSSGCIRVEYPVELAAYLLRHNPGWTTERIQKQVASDRTRGVTLRRSVPVHLLYWTAWVEGERVHFRPDVYDRDDAVAAALSAEAPATAPIVSTTGR